jgi:hypothetical protein
MTLGLNPEELRLRQRVQIKLWREEHPEMVRAYHKVYENKPEAKMRRAQWHAANRDKRAARQAAMKAARAEAASYLALTVHEQQQRRALGE